MKISNIILISFLTFLFGGITLLFIGSKYYKGVDYKADFAIQEKKTAPFSVIVAEPGSFFVLKNGREFSVSQSYLKDVHPNFAHFEVSNDTLYIYSVRKEESKRGHFVIVPEVYCKNVKSIIAKEKANVSLRNYQVDSLSINLNSSDFFWDFNKPAYVNVESKNSYLRLNGDNIEKMNLQLDKTKLYLNSQKGAKMLSGSLTNDSYIDGVIVDGTINIDIDNSSRMYFRN
ncbi:hypothetical protein [Flavobacterium sp. GSA192]|uniref:hypothetical protein n=1 Tax=Flavobacterium sp. GSA192 TaxID=2576304 RepID=UPI0011289195|nr:hypothetical protein [Flavobacterium sp. GSA192]